MMQRISHATRRFRDYLATDTRSFRHDASALAEASETSSPSTRFIILIAMAATLLLVLLMDVELNIYDEALILQGAAEVAHGAVPHRDFFSPYGPVQFWIVAGLFSALGKTMLVARLYDLAIRGGIIFACGLAARRLGLRPMLVVLVMLLETALLYAAGYYLYPVFPAVLCALAGTLLLIGGGPIGDGAGARGGGTSGGVLVATGALTGLTAAIRYDIGFFLLAAHLSTLAFLAWSTRARIATLVREVTLYGVGVLAIVGPLAVAGWASGALPGFIHDIIRFAPANYARMRGLPLPMPTRSVASLLPLISYVPFLVALLGIAWLTSTRQEPSDRTWLDPRMRLAVAIAFLVVLFSLKGVVRLSLVHSVLAMVPAMLLLPFLLSRRGPSFLWWSSAFATGLVLALIALNDLSMFLLAKSRDFDTLLPVRAAAGATAPAGAPCRSATLGIGRVDPNTLAAACYVAAHTSSADPLFVGAGRHDKLFAGNAALYFVADRRAATHWYHLEPGLETQDDIQRRMVDDLVRARPPLVAIDVRFDTMAEPNDSAKSSGVRFLDRFIADNYAPVAAFGSITILENRAQRHP